MAWEFKYEPDAAERAALAAGKNMVIETAPAGWTLPAVLESLPAPPPGPGPANLIVAPLASDLADVAGALAGLSNLAPIYSAGGLSRTGRVVRQGALGTLLATVSSARELVGRSVLKADRLRTVIVCWPELLPAEAMDHLGTVLEESRGAQRMVATGDPAAISDLLRQRFHRAQVARVAAAVPQSGVEGSGEVRYALVGRSGTAAAVRGALDVLDPDTCLIWDPRAGSGPRGSEQESTEPFQLGPNAAVLRAVDDARRDWIFSVALPTPEALAAMLATGGRVLALVRPPQLGYLLRMAPRARSLRIPMESDEQHQRAAGWRRTLRQRLDQRVPLNGLSALDPLFDEYDPALVAAAALEEAVAARPGVPAPQVPVWARIYVNAGRRDRVGPADLLGALINAGGLSKDSVGKIDLRESHSLVEVQPDQVERACGGLTGLTLKGRRLLAHVDRPSR